MNWIENIFSKGTLSGRWDGAYAQHGRSFPIQAALKHRGNKLSGSMVDMEPCHNQSLRAMLQESHMSNDEIEQFVAEIRSQFPDTPEGEIDYRSQLPEKSLVDGTVDGRQVSFVKRYEGYMEIEYVLNDLALPDTVHCELIHYTGELSENCNTIAGEWTIPPPDDNGATVSGTFQLVRRSPG